MNGVDLRWVDKVLEVFGFGPTWLQREMAGLSIGAIRETALGYVDDVAAVSSTLDDLPIIDAAVADFEAASGALLNRNRKTVIVGLGSWAGRLDWPLQWIGAAPS
jgi:hypothetical protein